jgi:sugar/nucleoside kinase (ribokinase family)
MKNRREQCAIEAEAYIEAACNAGSSYRSPRPKWQDRVREVAELVDLAVARMREAEELREAEIAAESKRFNDPGLP